MEKSFFNSKCELNLSTLVLTRTQKKGDIYIMLLYTSVRFLLHYIIFIITIWIIMIIIFMHYAYRRDSSASWITCMFEWAVFSGIERGNSAAKLGVLCWNGSAESSLQEMLLPNAPFHDSVACYIFPALFSFWCLFESLLLSEMQKSTRFFSQVRILSSSYAHASHKTLIVCFPIECKMQQ